VVSVLADVCGKGIAAALLVARLSAEVKHCLLSQPQPVDAMLRLNQAFCHDRWEGKFVTMLAAVLDPAENDVCIVNAGHMAPLLRRPSGEIEEVGESQGGLPLGIDGDSTYQQFSVRLAPGDSLIMYTDGVLDAENAQNERYGTERLYPMVAKQAASAPELGQQVISDVKRFIGNHPQADDICFTCFRRSE
jgi:serine phosphatase RsbU (regulator of sigma subunit)